MYYYYKILERFYGPSDEQIVGSHIQHVSVNKNQRKSFVIRLADVEKNIDGVIKKTSSRLLQKRLRVIFTRCRVLCRITINCTRISFNEPKKKKII